MRARGEYDQAFTGDVDGEESLIHHKLVRLPPVAIQRLSALVRKPTFERGYARDIAAQINHPVRERLRLNGDCYLPAYAVSLPMLGTPSNNSMPPSRCFSARFRNMSG